jgi:hypothetical protein
MSQDYFALLNRMRAEGAKEDMEGLSKHGVKPRQVPPEAPAVTSALKNQKK